MNYGFFADFHPTYYSSSEPVRIGMVRSGYSSGAANVVGSGTGVSVGTAVGSSVGTSVGT